MCNFGLINFFCTIFIYITHCPLFFLFLARACSSEGVASSAVGGAEATVQSQDPELAQICRGTPRTQTKKRGAREEKEGSLGGHLQRGGGGRWGEPTLE